MMKRGEKRKGDAERQEERRQEKERLEQRREGREKEKRGRRQQEKGAGRVFAKGVGFEKLFMIFIVGCLFGYFYEVILNFFMHLFQDGTIFLERRSGVIYGPFSIIYGLGAVLMAGVLAERKYKWWQLFLYGGLLCCVCEYVTGWLQQTFTGTMSWDYSDHFMNINGRTSLPIFVIWGVICVGFIGVVYPWLSKWIERIPAKWGEKFVKVAGVLLAVDMVISFSAVIRMGLRHKEVPSFTPYGQFLDTVYPDERVRAAYPNTDFVEDYER